MPNIEVIPDSHWRGIFLFASSDTRILTGDCPMLKVWLWMHVDELHLDFWDEVTFCGYISVSLIPQTQNGIICVCMCLHDILGLRSGLTVPQVLPTIGKFLWDLGTVPAALWASDFLESFELDAFQGLVCYEHLQYTITLESVNLQDGMAYQESKKATHKMGWHI